MIISQAYNIVVCIHSFALVVLFCKYTAKTLVGGVGYSSKVQAEDHICLLLCVHGWRSANILRKTATFVATAVNKQF